MPFKFWKREKPEKEKGEAEAKKEREERGPKGEPAPEKGGASGSMPVSPATAVTTHEPSPETPSAPEPAPGDLDAAVAELHAGLVDLGITIPGTKAVFGKRVAAYPDGTGAFLALYREKPFRAGTRILVDWLGFRVPSDFEPDRFLADLNMRLSSFKLAVQMSDLTWLDQELGLRKARLRLGDVEKVVRFKDARDLVKSVNELIASKRLVFLELETWSPDHAFFLTRDPKWEKLATTGLVVVKAPQTAVGGECGECGAPVGSNWHDCLSCGAVFGMD